MKDVYKRFPRLEERRRQLAGTLSGGEQQMLAVGRALMAKPKMILMDEPSMGLSPLLVKEIFAIIQEVNKQASRSCWWNRTQRWRWPSRTAPMCWKPATSALRATPRIC